MDTTPKVIEIAAVAHPDPRVRRLGFGLGDPYIEHCWSTVIGPSATLLLRRLPHLWAQHEPARLELGDLSRSLGLGGGTAPTSRLARSLDRVARFGLAEWAWVGNRLDVYTDVPPLTPRQLDQAPAWTRQVHTDLLDSRIDRVFGTVPAPPVPSMQDRLDRLQQHRGNGAPGLAR
jgi:hypothetical protein